MLQILEKLDRCTLACIIPSLIFLLRLLVGLAIFSHYVFFLQRNGHRSVVIWPSGALIKLLSWPTNCETGTTICHPPSVCRVNRGSSLPIRVPFSTVRNKQGAVFTERNYFARILHCARYSSDRKQASNGSSFVAQLCYVSSSISRLDDVLC